MIKQLLSILKTIFRMLKNIFIRPIKTLIAKMQNIAKGKQLIAAVPEVTKNIPKVLKSKPEKREDYFDWGSIYVAKSLVVKILIAVAALTVLYILVLHPLFTRWFWVKNFQIDDSALASYSGRVRVYYDEKFTRLEFEGKLNEGKAVGDGKEFYENGVNKYVGEYADGLYSGSGVLCYEDGSVMYKGRFSEGVYEGAGEYTDESGAVYTGTFEKGSINGYGYISKNGSLYYEGNFLQGQINGEGKTYFQNGTQEFVGTFNGGVLNGTGREYYSSGELKYNGTFSEGEYSGTGTLYARTGKKLYSGNFEAGVYSGSGTLYDKNGERMYSGDFENGLYNGNGALYGYDGSIIEGGFKDGSIIGVGTKTFVNGVKYEGGFAENMMSGKGTLSDTLGSFTYTGNFTDNDFDFGEIIGIDANKLREAMPSLLQMIENDSFYLYDRSFGIAVKCSFAKNDAPATVTEMFERPFNGEITVIKSKEDIYLPNALSVEKSDDKLPEWAADEFGTTPDSVDCYTALYKNVKVNYWTDKTSGELLLRSASALGNTSSVPGSGTGTDTDPTEDETYGLSEEEIAELFKELGLDPKDFASLGLGDD